MTPRIFLLTLVVISGCSRSSVVASEPGRRIATGPARGLRPSPDGLWLAYLDRCAHPPQSDLPADTVDCDLELIAVDGGSSRRIAEGVSSIATPVAWSRDGRALATLAEYDYASGRGKLVYTERGADPRTLASGASFFGFAPADGTLVFVAGGRLWIKRTGETEPKEMAGAEAVTTFDFNPQPALGPSSARPVLVLAARRAASAGGDLFGLAGWENRPIHLASQVGDYAFTPHGWLAFTVRGQDGYGLAAISTAVAHDSGKVSTQGVAGRPMGTKVQRFSFSPTSGAIAYLANVMPGRLGDLYVVGPGGTGQPERLAGTVGEYRWAASAERLVWIQEYDPRVRSGTLAVGGPGQRAKVLARNVDSFEVTPDGSRVAFLEHVTAGGYSVDLKLAEANTDARARSVASGVFGFAFSPDGKQLYYRTSCLRNAEACDLYSTRGAPDEKPRRLAEGIKSFELDPHRPERLLVTWSRKDLVALDLAVLQDGKLTALGRTARPGSAQFLGPDSRRLAYISADPKQAGVYVVEVP